MACSNDRWVTLDPHGEDDPAYGLDAFVMHSSFSRLPKIEPATSSQVENCAIKTEGALDTSLEVYIPVPSCRGDGERFQEGQLEQSVQGELPRVGLGQRQGFAAMSTADTKGPKLMLPEAAEWADLDVPSRFNANKPSTDEGSTYDEPVIIAPVNTLGAQLAPQNAAFLEIVFDNKGEEQRLQILERPLGAEFSKRRSGPIRVSKVHARSYACRLGLQVGWAIKSIDGKDVSRMNFQDTQEALKNGLMSLPPCSEE